MKITKATVKRINEHCLNPSNPASYIPAISIIGDVLNQSGIILGVPGHYSINNSNDYATPLILSDGIREFVSGTVKGEYAKRLFQGLYTRYPHWISCTFTHGLNGVDIYEANKLVKAILDN